MKRLAKWMITFITVLVLMGTASAALAQDNEPLPPELNRPENETLSASVVVTISPEQIKKHVLRGEVLNVDATAGTLVVEAKGGKSGQWTVETTPETKIRVPKVDNPTLADIPVGAQVVVMGQPAEAGSQTFTARGIGVIPAGLKGNLKLMGEVTDVSDSSFIVLTKHRGKVTVLVDESTEYRARGNQTASFADIKVGVKVLVAGEPVEGQEKTVKAKLVGLKK